MARYRASISYFVKEQEQMGGIVSRLVLAERRPEIHEVRVRYLGENPMLGVGRFEDGREVDTRARHYSLEVTFESDLAKREAFQLADSTFGSVTDGFDQLEEGPGLPRPKSRWATRAGSPAEHPLAQVFVILHPLVEHELTIASWLCTPEPLLDDLTPGQWIGEGRDAEPLLEAARRYAGRLSH